MKNHSLIIGIDVSKKTLDLVGINSENQTLLKHQIISNKEKDIVNFIIRIIKLYSKEQLLFAFENTGIYSMLLAYVLSRKNIDYCKLPALEIHQSKGIKRGKSDKSDALMIAQYVITNRFKIKVSLPTQENLIQLKMLHTQREKIVKDIKKYNNNKEYDHFLSKRITGDDGVDEFILLEKPDDIENDSLAWSINACSSINNVDRGEFSITVIQDGKDRWKKDSSRLVPKCSDGKQLQFGSHVIFKHMISENISTSDLWKDTE